MNQQISMEQLLRWRLSQAETEAPPSPRAARLLELARPWWDRFPDRARALLERLGGVQVVFGHALAEPRSAREGHPVPALIATPEGEVDASALMVYLSIRDQRLRCRFRLSPSPADAEEPLEVTFVSDKAARPILSTQAVPSAEKEYRIDEELPEEVARAWEALKVSDRMPFRLILRTEESPRQAGPA